MLKFWLQEVETYKEHHARVWVLGNKIDLERVVTVDMVEVAL